MKNLNARTSSRTRIVVYLTPALVAGGVFLGLWYGNNFLRPPAFIDTFEQAGLSRRPQPGGASWTDYDHDGDLDLLLAGGDVGLYRNTGQGTFTDVTRESGLGSRQAALGIFGDYNNDGCPDLYLAGRSVPESLYRNNCDGTFREVTAAAGMARKKEASGTVGAAWADYDNDGYLDLYVASYGYPDGPETAEYTLDPNILYRSNGDSTFTDVTERAGVTGLTACGLPPMRFPHVKKVEGGLKRSFQPVWFDYNNDGRIDLFIATDSAVSPLYKNNGDGTFSEVTKEAGLCRVATNMGVTVGDYDTDGDLDLYTTNSGANFFWNNNGDGTFSEVAAETKTSDFLSVGWGVGFFDYDNDGDIDLFVANSVLDSKFSRKSPGFGKYGIDKLYENTGVGTFAEMGRKQGIFGTDPKKAAAFGDYDANGFIDIVVMSSSFAAEDKGRLYENRGNGNHWITVRLVGTKSNRDGVGTIITVASGAVRQTRQVTSGESYISQNSPWQTFGLGARRSADAIEIHWPSGVVQRLANVPANQILTVLEER